jgi:hypothetical protein
MRSAHLILRYELDQIGVHETDCNLIVLLFSLE